MAHVLVVEDDAETRRLLTVLMQRNGLECTAVDNGVCAMETLQRVAYDAVILDLVLPRASGFEVLYSIARATPELLSRVIVCTALPAAQLRELTELSRVGAVIVKPADVFAIVDAVLRAIALTDN